jgi:hypothetical protein
MKNGAIPKPSKISCPPILSALLYKEPVRQPQPTVGTFQKVGECLCRYSSNGVYYARIKSAGKEIRRRVETTDSAIARRNLGNLRDDQRQIDRSKSRMTFRELCETDVGAASRRRSSLYRSF